MIFLISFSSSKSSLRILKSSLTFILPSVQFFPFEFIINSYRTFSTTNEIQSTDKLSFRFHATVDEISTKQRIYRNISQPRFYHARNTGTIGIQRRLVDWICRGRRYKRLVSGTLPSTRHANAVSNER